MRGTEVNSLPIKVELLTVKTVQKGKLKKLEQKSGVRSSSFIVKIL